MSRRHRPRSLAPHSLILRNIIKIDVLIYSKNPLEDVAIVEDFGNNLKLIVKDGKVYKNTL